MCPLDSSFNTDLSFPDLFLQRIRAAGDVLCEMQGRNQQLDKMNGSFTTTADLSSQEIILQAVEEFFPHSTVVTEESDDRVALSEQFPLLNFPDATDTASDLPKSYISIDPNDGTAFYTNNSDHFSISIGFVANHRPVGGIVYQPRMERMHVCNSVHSSFGQLADCHSLKESLIGLDICKSVDLSLYIELLWPLIQCCRYPENLPSVVSGLHLLQGITCAWMTTKARNWDVAGVASMICRSGGCVHSLVNLDGEWQLMEVDWRVIRMPPLLFTASSQTASKILDVLRNSEVLNPRIYTIPR
jgi:fructose-1,6-bisphosphatase/inositol monophosphatase family enzyme